MQAEPESRKAHGARAEIYAARRKTELSLMARGNLRQRGGGVRRENFPSGIDSTGCRLMSYGVI